MVAGDDGLYDTFREEADILLVTAGGGGAGWSACIPAWAPMNNSRAVTQLVRVPTSLLDRPAFNPQCAGDRGRT